MKFLVKIGGFAAAALTAAALTASPAAAHQSDPAHNFQDAMAAINAGGTANCAATVCQTGTTAGGDTVTVVTASPSTAFAAYQASVGVNNDMLTLGAGIQNSTARLGGVSKTDASRNDTGSKINGGADVTTLTVADFGAGSQNIEGYIAGGSRDAANWNQGAWMGGEIIATSFAVANDIGGSTSNALALTGNTVFLVGNVNP